MIFLVYQLLFFAPRLDPMPSYEPSVGETVNSEEVATRGNKELRQAAQDGAQAQKGKGGSNKGSKGSAKSHMQQR